MTDGVGGVNPHQPSIQQTQRVTQPPATDANQVDDPNRGNQTRELLDDAIVRHARDESDERRQIQQDTASGNNERGQALNITV